MFLYGRIACRPHDSLVKCRKPGESARSKCRPQKAIAAAPGLTRKATAITFRTRFARSPTKQTSRGDWIRTSDLLVPNSTVARAIVSYASAPAFPPSQAVERFGSMPRQSVAQAVELFLAAVRPTVSPPTHALYEHYLSRFSQHFGRETLGSLTPARLLQWSHKYHPLSCVQRLYAWATVEARLLKVNPIAGMRRKRNGHRRRVLSRLERVRLLRCCKPAFRLLAVALVESIARPREMRAVRWGDLRTSGSPAWSIEELAAGRCFFWVDRFKGQALRSDRFAVRVIPISPRLGRLLVRLWGDGFPADSAIFLNGHRRPWTVNAVRCQFRRLRVRAGLLADLRGENVVAYSLRHTSATDAVGAGIKGFTLAELMGHSDIRMTQRYVHLRPDHLLEAMGRLAEWKQGGRSKKDRTESRRNAPGDDGRVS